VLHPEAPSFIANGFSGPLRTTKLPGVEQKRAQTPNPIGADMNDRTSEHSPQAYARLAGVSWLMTILTGAFAMFAGGRAIVPGDPAATAANILAHESLFRLGIAANLSATAWYLAATLFVYGLLKPVNRSLSLLAAFFSLVGCAIGVVGFALQLAPLVILRGAQTLSVFSVEQLRALAFVFLRVQAQASNIGFVFFGLHCLLVGGLILRSTFLPRTVGVLMVGAGLGWLTDSVASLLSPAFARLLSPYILIPGILGEMSLTLWLLVFGVSVRQWQEQAGAERGMAMVAGHAQPRRG
jgi:hypothetical protein